MAWESAGGGSVGILNAAKPGKMEPTKVPLVTGHKGAVLDLDFCPFNDSILATASEDTTVKIWNLPNEGFEGHKEDAVQTLHGHTKKVGAIKWHPIANNILASSATDQIVKVWDVETGQAKYKIEGHTSIIQSVEWSYDGSLLATNSKDKNVRILDPRNQTVVATCESHVGVKGGRCIWLGKHNYVCTVGFGKGATREYKVFDQRKMDAALCSSNLDSAAGVIMPFYDEDSDVLFLAGKGDGQIRYYEFVPEEEPSKVLTGLSQYSSNNPTAAACALPRRNCDVSVTEIIRIYKISKGVIYPLQFQVPRKSEHFAEDIYPPARGDEPALKKDEWFSGSNATPKLVSLDGGFVAKEAATTSFVKNEAAEQKLPSGKDLESAYQALQRKVAELESELEKRDARIAELESK
jgi:WD40 repeat protein